MLYNYKGTKIEASSKVEAIDKIIAGKDLSDEEIFERAERGDKSILKLPKEKLMIKNNGWTPIHYLAIGGDKEILKLDKSLLRIKNNDGYTPIHYLVRTGIEKFKKGMKYLFNPFQMDY